MKWWGIGCLLLTLSACAGLGQSSPTSREALSGLAASAAQGLLAQPPWPPERTTSTTILLRPAEIDAALPISAAALNEALGRALLSREDSPHVLDWVPNSLQGATEEQWLLQAHLKADMPPLHLSDRTLQPYTLQFDLSRPDDPGSQWQWQADGALDLDALPSTPVSSP